MSDKEYILQIISSPVKAEHLEKGQTVRHLRACGDTFGATYLDTLKTIFMKLSVRVDFRALKTQGFLMRTG